MTQQRDYCAERSVSGGERLEGSADVVTAWIMFEHRPAWSARPLDDGSVPPAVVDGLSAIARAFKNRGFKPRVQLVRQPARSAGDRVLFVHLTHGAGQHEFYRFEGGGGRVPEIDGVTLIEDPRVYQAQRLDTPHYFVCTNGQRDLCCARFGLPVFSALNERVAGRAWQVTHVGGHRFAPNVLVLPGGALYGRVTPDSLPSFIDTVERGGVVADLLRGRSWRDPAAQAAEIYLQRETGQWFEDAVEVTQTSPDRCRVSFPAAGWHVDLHATTYEQLASCGDTQPKPVQTWSLVACVQSGARPLC